MLNVSSKLCNIHNFCWYKLKCKWFHLFGRAVSLYLRCLISQFLVLPKAVGLCCLGELLFSFGLTWTQFMNRLEMVSSRVSFSLYQVISTTEVAKFCSRFQQGDCCSIWMCQLSDVIIQFNTGISSVVSYTFSNLQDSQSDLKLKLWISISTAGTP